MEKQERQTERAKSESHIQGVLSEYSQARPVENVMTSKQVADMSRVDNSVDKSASKQTVTQGQSFDTEKINSFAVDDQVHEHAAQVKKTDIATSMAEGMTSSQGTLPFAEKHSTMDEYKISGEKARTSKFVESCKETAVKRHHTEGHLTPSERTIPQICEKPDESVGTAKFEANNLAQVKMDSKSLGEEAPEESATQLETSTGVTEKAATSMEKTKVDGVLTFRGNLEGESAEVTVTGKVESFNVPARIAPTSKDVVPDAATQVKMTANVEGESLLTEKTPELAAEEAESLSAQMHHVLQEVSDKAIKKELVQGVSLVGERSRQYQSEYLPAENVSLKFDAEPMQIATGSSFIQGKQIVSEGTTHFVPEETKAKAAEIKTTPVNTGESAIQKAVPQGLSEVAENSPRELLAPDAASTSLKPTHSVSEHSQCAINVPETVGSVPDVETISGLKKKVCFSEQARPAMVPKKARNDATTNVNVVGEQLVTEVTGIMQHGDLQKLGSADFRRQESVATDLVSMASSTQGLLPEHTTTDVYAEGERRTKDLAVTPGLSKEAIDRDIAARREQAEGILETVSNAETFSEKSFGSRRADTLHQAVSSQGEVKLCPTMQGTLEPNQELQSFPAGHLEMSPKAKVTRPVQATQSRELPQTLCQLQGESLELEDSRKLTEAKPSSVKVIPQIDDRDALNLARKHEVQEGILVNTKHATKLAAEPTLSKEASCSTESNKAGKVVVLEAHKEGRLTNKDNLGVLPTTDVKVMEMAKSTVTKTSTEESVVQVDLYPLQQGENVGDEKIQPLEKSTEDTASVSPIQIKGGIDSMASKKDTAQGLNYASDRASDFSSTQVKAVNTLSDKEPCMLQPSATCFGHLVGKSLESDEAKLLATEAPSLNKPAVTDTPIGKTRKRAISRERSLGRNVTSEGAQELDTCLDKPKSFATTRVLKKDACLAKKCEQEEGVLGTAEAAKPLQTQVSTQCIAKPCLALSEADKVLHIPHTEVEASLMAAKDHGHAITAAETLKERASPKIVSAEEKSSSVAFLCHKEGHLTSKEGTEILPRLTEGKQAFVSEIEGPSSCRTSTEIQGELQVVMSTSDLPISAPRKEETISSSTETEHLSTASKTSRNEGLLQLSVAPEPLGSNLLEGELADEAAVPYDRNAVNFEPSLQGELSIKCSVTEFEDVQPEKETVSPSRVRDALDVAKKIPNTEGVLTKPIEIGSLETVVARYGNADEREADSVNKCVLVAHGAGSSAAEDTTSSLKVEEKPGIQVVTQVAEKDLRQPTRLVNAQGIFLQEDRAKCLPGDSTVCVQVEQSKVSSERPGLTVTKTVRKEGQFARAETAQSLEPEHVLTETVGSSQTDYSSDILQRKATHQGLLPEEATAEPLLHSQAKKGIAQTTTTEEAASDCQTHQTSLQEGISRKTEQSHTLEIKELAATEATNPVDVRIKPLQKVQKTSKEEGHLLKGESTTLLNELKKGVDATESIGKDAKFEKGLLHAYEGGEFSQAETITASSKEECGQQMPSVVSNQPLNKASLNSESLGIALRTDSVASFQAPDFSQAEISATEKKVTGVGTFSTIKLEAQNEGFLAPVEGTSVTQGESAIIETIELQEEESRSSKRALKRSTQQGALPEKRIAEPFRHDDALEEITATETEVTELPTQKTTMEAHKEGHLPMKEESNVFETDQHIRQTIEALDATEKALITLKQRKQDKATLREHEEGEHLLKCQADDYEQKELKGVSIKPTDSDSKVLGKVSKTSEIHGILQKGDKVDSLTDTQVEESESKVTVEPNSHLTKVSMKETLQGHLSQLDSVDDIGKQQPKEQASKVASEPPTLARASLTPHDEGEQVQLDGAQVYPSTKEPKMSTRPRSVQAISLDTASKDAKLQGIVVKNERPSIIDTADIADVSRATEKVLEVSATSKGLKMAHREGHVSEAEITTALTEKEKEKSSASVIEPEALGQGVREAHVLVEDNLAPQAEAMELPRVVPDEIVSKKEGSEGHDRASKHALSQGISGQTEEVTSEMASDEVIDVESVAQSKHGSRGSFIVQVPLNMGEQAKQERSKAHTDGPPGCDETTAKKRIVSEERDQAQRMPLPMAEVALGEVSTSLKEETRTGKGRPEVNDCRAEAMRDPKPMGNLEPTEKLEPITTGQSNQPRKASANIEEMRSSLQENRPSEQGIVPVAEAALDIPRDEDALSEGPPNVLSVSLEKRRAVKAGTAMGQSDECGDVTDITNESVKTEVAQEKLEEDIKPAKHFSHEEGVSDHGVAVV